MNQLVHTRTGEALVEKLTVKETFWGRIRGLLFYRELEPDRAFLLVSTRRVHTFGMLFPIDLYFFSDSMCLIENRCRVMPWRLPASPQGTEHILEVQHQVAAEPLRIKTGEQASILRKIMS